MFAGIRTDRMKFFIYTLAGALTGLSPQTLQLIEGIIFLIFVAVFADRKALKVIK